MTSCVLNGDGRLQLFGVGNDSAVWQTFQVAPGSSWSELTPIGGGTHSDVTVGINLDGRLEIFIINDSGNCWHVWQTSPGSGDWSQWQNLGGHDVGGGLAGTPAVCYNAGARLELFARASDGTIWHNWQNTFNSSSDWGGWTSLDGGTHNNVAVDANLDGRLEIFVVNDQGNCWHSWQTTPASSDSAGGSWSAWEGLGGSNLGGGLRGTPTIARTLDGRLEIFVRANDATIWHKWQTATNGPYGWSDWQALGGGTHNDLAVATNRDGRLEVFLVNDPGNCWHRWQQAPESDTSLGGTWADWEGLGGSNLGGGLRGAPTVAQNQDGRLELFAVVSDGSFWHTSQTAPSGPWGWTGWSSLGAPSPEPGPHVVKWSYLVEYVWVDGTAQGTPGQPITGDNFGLVPDPSSPFADLATYVNGLPIKCETYPEGIGVNYPAAPGKGVANQFLPWALGRKDPNDPNESSPFMVQSPSGARPLQEGDHVRILGHLLVENGHPDQGSPWLELHPFDYTNIVDLSAPDTEWSFSSPQAVGTFAIVAPLYSRATYSGADGNVVLSSLRTFVSAKLSMRFPVRNGVVLGFKETVNENNLTMPLDQIRQVTFSQQAGTLDVRSVLSANSPPTGDLLAQRVVFHATYSFVDLSGAVQ